MAVVGSGSDSASLDSESKIGIVVPVTPHAVLRGAVRPAVVPGLVLFAAVAPFIGVAPALALQEDQAHLDHCPVAQQDTVLASLRSAVEQVKGAFDIWFVVEKPVTAALAEDIIEAFDCDFHSWRSELRSELECSAKRTLERHSEMLKRALMDTVWVEHEVKRVATDASTERDASARWTIPLVASHDSPAKRSRDDDGEGDSSQAITLNLDVHSHVEEEYADWESTVTVSARHVLFKATEVTCLDVSTADAISAHFRGTRFDQLLTPVGMVALVLCVANVLTDDNDLFRGELHSCMGDLLDALPDDNSDLGSNSSTSSSS